MSILHPSDQITKWLFDTHNDSNNIVCKSFFLSVGRNFEKCQFLN